MEKRQQSLKSRDYQRRKKANGAKPRQFRKEHENSNISWLWETWSLVFGSCAGRHSGRKEKVTFDFLWVIY